MPVPVLLALFLVGGVALVVFLSARRQLSTWLLLASVGLFVGGGVLWAHEPSHRHAPPEVAAVALPPVATLASSPYDVAGDVYARDDATDSAGSSGITITFISSDTALPADTASGPNHLPAIIVFALGGAAGLVGVVLKRRRPAPTA